MTPPGDRPRDAVPAGETPAAEIAASGMAPGAVEGEHTVVDHELMSRLAATPGGGRGSAPDTGDATADATVDATADARGHEEITDPDAWGGEAGTGAPAAQLTIDDLGDAFPTKEPADAGAAGTDELGPAFPEDEPSSGTQRLTPAPGPDAPADAGLGRPPFELASLVDAIAGSAADSHGVVLQPTASATLPSAIDDAWAEIDAQSSWRSVAAEGGTGRLSAPALARQTTDVRRPGADAAPPAARLIGLAGPEQGLEFALGAEVLVGRGPSCSVVLRDSSVSREHARVYRDGDVYVVVDRKSGNGTFLNGERVGRSRLRSGDELRFGESRFRFLEVGDVFKPVDERGSPVLPGRQAALEPAASAGRPEVAWYLLLSLLIVVGTVVIALAVVYFGRGEPRPQATAAQYLAGGVEAMDRRDWAAAQSQLEVFVTLEPGAESGRRYLAIIEREKAFERQLAAARTAFERGELLRAYTQATGVADSVYTPEARQLAAAIDAELDKRVVAARAAVDGARAREALELLSVVEAIHPGHPDVAALLERGRRLASDGRGERAAGDRDERQAAVAARAVDEATRLFATGQTEAALAKLAGAGPGRDIQDLAAKIVKFRDVFEAAVVEHRAKRADTAIRLLEEAKAIEERITGPIASTPQDDVRRKLADMYYVRGAAASLAERLPDAVQAFQAALENDPSHVPTRRKTEELAARADEVLEAAEGLRQRDPDRAKALYRALLQMLPAADGRRHKARQRLDAMP